MGIFKAYDIRGVYPTEINETLAGDIARAMASLFKDAKKIGVGRDARLSSPSIAKAVIDAFLEYGRDVVDIGLISTPMAYFASGRYGFDITVQVTASHNPKEYCGMKICLKDAAALSYETGIKDIERLVQSKSFDPVAANKGAYSEIDVSEDYINHCLSFAHLTRPLKVVVDGSNGAIGPIAQRLLSKIDGLEFKVICGEPDGNFPCHSPNPMEDEALEMLKSEVKAMDADFGAIFDADGDRIMFVDHLGERVQADLLTAVIAKDVLKREPGANIIYDLRSSWAVKEYIEANGGKAVVTRVGHSFIKKLMRELSAPFAGEFSAHYYFKDNYYADSGMLALVAVMNIVSEQGKRLRDIIAEIKKYYSTGEINYRVENADAIMEKIEQKYVALGPKNVMRLDGLTVEFDDWWFNLRKSNTEPLLRLNLEAKSQGLMEEKLKEVEGLIK